MFELDPPVRHDPYDAADALRLVRPPSPDKIASTGFDAVATDTHGFPSSASGTQSQGTSHSTVAAKEQPPWILDLQTFGAACLTAR